MQRSKKRAHLPSRPARTARNTRSTKSTALRIVVADHKPLDRGGIIGLLEGEDDLRVVGEAASVAEAIQECEALDPDLLVLALNLPGQESAPAIPQLRAQLPSLRILALAERAASDCLVLNPPSRQRVPSGTPSICDCGTDCLNLAVSQGAMGTMRRSADPEDLFRAVRAVCRGQAWYDPTTANGLLIASAPNGAGAPPQPLSERELDVGALLAEGLSNKEISTALGISEPTVKKHIGHILEKLRLADRLQAGLFLARHPLALKRRG